jgi:starch phosphorylase
VESNALYELLEREIVPLFYDRGSDGRPQEWLARMKAAIQQTSPFFNSSRMVHDYSVRFYLPAARRRQRLAEHGMAGARALAQWNTTLKQHWPELRIESLEADASPDLTVGDRLEVRARIHLGTLTPEDVSVDLYYGPLDPQRQIAAAETASMAFRESTGEGTHLFAATISCRTSGRHGYTLRILPRHRELVRPFEPGLILWA